MEAAATYDAGAAAPADPPAPEKFECWGYVELMGHNRIAGKLTEQSIAGRNLLRVDVPLDDGGFRTEFFGASAIFRITPAEEAIVRKLVARLQPEPVFAFMLSATPRLSQSDDFELDP